MITSKVRTVGDSSATNDVSPIDPEKVIAKFMFGVIGIAEYSSLNGYLEMIDRLITKTVGEETKMSMKFEFPSVLNIKIDGTFVPCRETFSFVN